MIATTNDTEHLLTQAIGGLQEPYHTIAVEYLLAVNPKNKGTLSKRLNMSAFMLHGVPIDPFDLACTHTLHLLRETFEKEGVEKLGDLPIDGL